MPKLPDIPSELWNMFQSSKLEDETQDAFSTNQFLDETLDLGDDIIQQRLKDEARRTHGPRLEQEFLGSLRDEQEYNQALDDADQIEQGFGAGVNQVAQEYQNSLPTPEEEFSQFANDLRGQIAPPEEGGPPPNPNPPPLFVEQTRPPLDVNVPPPSLGGADGVFPDVPYGVGDNVEPGDFSIPGRPLEPVQSGMEDPYGATKFQRQAQQIQQARPQASSEEVSPWIRVGEAIGEAIQSAISGLVPTNEAKQQASQDLRTRTLEDPSTPLPFEDLGRTVTSASQAAVRDIATNAASGVSPSQYLGNTSLRLAEDAVVGTVSAAQASPLVQAAVKGIQDTFQYVQGVYQSPEVQEGIRRGRAQQTPTGQRFLGNISANMLAPDVERIWKPIEEHQVVPAWTDYWADRTSEKRNIAVAKTLQAVPDVTSETLQELIGGGEEGRVFLNPLGMHDTPVIGGLGQFMGVQKNARFGVGDVVANFVGRGAGVPGAALEAAQWAGMVGVVIDTTKSVQERALALGVPGAILGTQHLLRFVTPPAVQMIKAAGGSVQNAIDALSTKFGRKLTEPEVIGVVREWESGTYLNVPESTGTEASASGSPSYGPAMGIVGQADDAGRAAAELPYSASRRYGVQTLYHETGPSNVSSFVHGDASIMEGRWVSPDPDLALGQGSNKGVLIEFGNTSQIEVRAERGKPGVRMLDDGTKAPPPEMTVLKPPHGNTDLYVKSITVKPDVGIDVVARRRLRSSGWIPEVLEDGSVRFDNPRFVDAPAGTPGGLLPGTTPQMGTATRIGGRALGSGVGAAYQESQQEGSSPESILQAGLQGAGTSLLRTGVNRLARDAGLRRAIGREMGTAARAIGEAVPLDDRIPATGYSGMDTKSARRASQARPRGVSYEEVYNRSEADRNNLGVTGLWKYSVGGYAEEGEKLKYLAMRASNDELTNLPDDVKQGLLDNVNTALEYQNRPEVQATMKNKEKNAVRFISKKNYADLLDDPKALRELAEFNSILHNGDIGRALNQLKMGEAPAKLARDVEGIKPVTEALKKPSPEMIEALRAVEAGEELTPEHVENLRKLDEFLGGVAEFLDEGSATGRDAGTIGRSVQDIDNLKKKYRKEASTKEASDGASEGSGGKRKSSSKKSDSETGAADAEESSPSVAERLGELDQKIGAEGTYLDPSADWQESYDELLENLIAAVRAEAEKRESGFANMTPEQQQKYVQSQINARMGRSIFALEKEAREIVFDTPVSDELRQQVSTAVETDYVNRKVAEAHGLFKIAKEDWLSRVKRGEDPQLAWENVRTSTGLDDTLQQLAEYNNRGELQKQRLETSVDQWYSERMGTDDDFGRITKGEANRPERQALADHVAESRELLKDAAAVPKEMSQASQDAVENAKKAFFESLDRLRELGPLGEDRARVLQVDFEHTSARNLQGRMTSDRAKLLQAEVRSRIKGAKSSDDLDQMDIRVLTQGLWDLGTQEARDMARKLERSAVDKTNMIFRKEEADLARQVLRERASLLHGREFMDIIDDINNTPGGKAVADQLLSQAIKNENTKAMTELAKEMSQIRARGGEGAGAAIQQILSEIRSFGEAGELRANELNRNLMKHGLATIIDKSTMPANKRYELITLLANMSEADFTDGKALIKLIDKARNEGWTDVLFDGWREYQVVNVLSNPELSGTFGLNTVGGAVNLGSHVAATVLDSMAAALARPFGVKAEVASPTALLKGMAGATGLGLKRGRESIAHGYADDLLQNALRTGNLQGIRREYLSSAPGPLGKIGTMMHLISTRPMTAGDAFFGTVIEMGHLAALAETKSKELAKQGIRMSPDEIVRTAHRKFPELVEQARNVRNKALYTDPLPKFLSGLGPMLHSDKASVRALGSMVVLFYRIPTNVVLQTLRNSPVGAVYNAGKLVEGAVKSRAGEAVSHSEMIQRARQMMMGGVMTYVGYDLYQRGMLKGSGAVPGHEDRYGKAPYGAALKINGEWVPISSVPGGASLGMVADLFEYVDNEKLKRLNDPKLVTENGKQALKTTLDPEEYWRAMAQGGLGAAANAVKSLPQVRAATWATQLATNRGDNAVASFLGGLANRQIPLDGLLGWMAAVGDKYDRYPETANEAEGGLGESIRRRVAVNIPDALMQQVPRGNSVTNTIRRLGSRSTVPFEATQLGRPVMEPRSVVGKAPLDAAKQAAAQYIFPPSVRVMPVEKSEVRDVYRTYQVPFSRESEEFRDMPLTAMQRRGVQKLYGDLMEDASAEINRAVSGGGVNDLVRRDRLRTLSNRKHRTALQKYLRENYPDLLNNARVKKYLESSPRVENSLP